MELYILICELLRVTFKVFDNYISHKFLNYSFISNDGISLTVLGIFMSQELHFLIILVL